MRVGVHVCALCTEVRDQPQVLFLHESQLVFGDRIFHMCVSIGITTEVRYLRRDQWGKNLNGVIS